MKRTLLFLFSLLTLLVPLSASAQITWKAVPLVDGISNEVGYTYSEGETVEVLLTIEGYNSAYSWMQNFNNNGTDYIMDSSKCWITLDGNKIEPISVTQRTGTPFGIRMSFGSDLAGGTYNVVVEEGLVVPSKVSNNGATLDNVFSVAGGGDAVPTMTGVDPADGSTIASLPQTVVMSFNMDICPSNITEMTAPKDCVAILTDSKGTESRLPIFYVEDDITRLQFDIPEGTAAGECTVTIPSGSVLEYWNEAPGNEEITLHYTIEGASAEVTTFEPWYLDPDGDTITLPYKAQIGYNEMLVLNPNAEKAAVKNADGSTIATYPVELGEDPHWLVVNITDTDFADGRYTLVVPQGVAYEDGNESNVTAETILNFVIEAPAVNYFEGWTVTPAAGEYASRDDLDVKVTINFPNADGKSVTVADMSTSLVTVNGIPMYISGDNGFVSFWGNWLWDVAGEADRYEVVIAPEALTIDGVKNTEAISIVYTIAAPAVNYFENAKIVYPVEGETYESVAYMEVKLPNLGDGELTNVAFNKISVDNGEVAASFGGPENVELTDNGFKITFAEELTEAGTYNINIRPGAIEISDQTNEDALTASFVIEPKVVSNVTDIPWEVSAVRDTNNVSKYASDGDITIGNVNRIQVKVVKPADMAFNDWSALAMGFTVNSEVFPYVKVSNGTDAYNPSAASTNGYVVVNLDFETPITVEGVYSISIPEGLITFGNGTISVATEIVNAFTIEAKPDYFADWKVTEPTETTVASISKIVINVPNAEGQTIEVAENADVMVQLRTPYDEGYISKTYSSIAVEGNDIVISYDEVAEAGDYVFVVMKGAFTIDGVECPELEQNFTIEQKADVDEFITLESVDPVNGSTIEALPQEVSVLFAQDVYPAMYSWTNNNGWESMYAILTDKNGNSQNVDITWGRNENLKSVIFEIPEGFEAGVCTVEIPEGMFVEYSEELIPTEKVSLSYTIAGGEPSVPVNAELFEGATWADGDKGASFSGGTVVFPAIEKDVWGNPIYRASVDGSKASELKAIGPDGEEIACTYLEANSRGVFASFYPESTTPGTYKVTFPEGFITLTEAGSPVCVNPDFSVSYEVEAAAPVDFKYVVYVVDNNGKVLKAEEATALTSVQAIMVDAYTDNASEYVTYDNWNLYKDCYVENVAGDRFYFAGFTQPNFTNMGITPAGENDYLFRMNISPAVAAEGTYTLHLAEGLLRADNTPSPEAAVENIFTIVPNYYKDVTFTPEEGAVIEVLENGRVFVSITGNNAFFNYNATVTPTLVNKTTGTEYKFYKVEYNGVEISYNDFEFYFNNKENVVEEGEYEVVFPAGQWNTLFGDHPGILSPKMTLNFTIKQTKPVMAYTLNPEDGATMESIKTVTVTFLGTVDGAECGGTPSEVTLTCGNKVYNAKPFVENNSDYTAYSFEWDEITEPGEYTLHIPAGMFYDYQKLSDLNQSVYNPEITAVYTVTGKKGSYYEYPVWTPAEGVVSDLSEISVVFPNSNNWVDVDDAIVKAKVVNTTTGNEYNYYTYENNADENGSTIKFNNGEAITEPGEYTVTFPEGCWYNMLDADEISPEFVLHYTIMMPVDYYMGAYTDPASDGVALQSLSEVMIYFPNAGDVNIDMEDSDAKKILINGDIAPNMGWALADIDNPMAAIKLFYDTITENGTYTMVVPAEIMTINGQANPELTFVFKVDDGTGIRAILGDADTFTVLDYAGRVIVRNGDAESIRNLENGMYIINGEKILIRK